MNAAIKQVVFILLSCALAIAGEPAGGLTREEALKRCRTLGGKESGKLWFDQGDKEGPYHHAGRLILSPGGETGYAVSKPDGTLSEVGLDVPDDAAELHMDFFTGKSGHGWVTTHYFLPEISPDQSPNRKDNRSTRQKALGPAAEFAIIEGNLPLLEVLVAQGLELNEYLDFKEQTTALSTAIWENKLDIAKYLLKRGVDKNKRGRSGERPIATAVDLKRGEFCKLLARPDAEEKSIAGVPEGVLEEVFAGRDSREVLFLRWNGEEPPEDMLKWLRQTLPGALPAGRMKTLERRPLGAKSWYVDQTDGKFGSLLEISVKPADNGWNVRIRDTVGPSLAGGGHETQFTKHYGYWIGKMTSSWDE